MCQGLLIKLQTSATLKQRYEILLTFDIFSMVYIHLSTEKYVKPRLMFAGIRNKLVVIC